MVGGRRRRVAKRRRLCDAFATRLRHLPPCATLRPQPTPAQSATASSPHPSTRSALLRTYRVGPVAACLASRDDAHTRASRVLTDAVRVCACKGENVRAVLNLYPLFSHAANRPEALPASTVLAQTVQRWVVSLRGRAKRESKPEPAHTAAAAASPSRPRCESKDVRRIRHLALAFAFASFKPSSVVPRTTCAATRLRTRRNGMCFAYLSALHVVLPLATM